STGCADVNDAANGGAATSGQVRSEFRQAVTRQGITPDLPATAPVTATFTPARAQSSLRVRSGCMMPDQHREFKAEPDVLREQMRGLGSGYDQIAAEAGRRHRVRPGGASRLADGRTVEQASVRPGIPGVAGVPGFRLVIGVDGDQRAWVPVANALLDRIASGAVRAGSRVPSVTSLGLERPVASGTAARAFRALASEGVLYWLPGLGYHVRTSITAAAGTGPRRDGGLTAVLPGGDQGQQAGHAVAAVSGAGAR
ncbi:MAG: hypothetical protein ABSB76_02170, partial [Streptosporangiaceae bacterium]